MRYQSYKSIVLFAFAVLLAMTARGLDEDMARFATSKRNQVTELAGSSKVSSQIMGVFDAVRLDDWETASNLMVKVSRDLQSKTNAADATGRLQAVIWMRVYETMCAYMQFHAWNNQLLHGFASNLLTSLPKGSIYLGGSDAGGYVICAIEDNEFADHPVFVLTQHQLGQLPLCGHLNARYGNKLFIPSTNDFTDAYNNYMTDVRKQLQAGMRKSAEEIHRNCAPQISRSLAKLMLEKNPNCEVYIQDGVQIKWMLPNLSPHGVIMELHHKPLSELSGETLHEDHKYWKRLTSELVGDWFSEKTPVKDICEFNDEIYLHKNLKNFKGNSAYIEDKSAQECYAKLRSSIAALYVWRMEQAEGVAGKERMRMEADFAFRQALALCPTSAETVGWYSSFLVDINRPDEAMMIAETAMHLKPEDPSLKAILARLHKSS